MNICKSIDPDHSWKGRSTLMWSSKDGLDEFLAAPATAPQLDGRHFGGGWTNESVLMAVLGVRGIHVKDPATFDAVSQKYDVKCSTFADAWKVCARSYDGYGHRDWRDLDIEVLRDCCPAFRALQLPEWVEEMLLDEAVQAHAQALEDARDALDKDPKF